LCLEADLEVDPVDPQVDVVGALQRALPERRGVVCHWPVSRVTVAADRPGPGAEELLPRRAEVAAGQVVQVQQRQHLGNLRGLPGPRGQDCRGERLRSPVASSMRLSLTRGARTAPRPPPWPPPAAAGSRCGPPAVTRLVEPGGTRIDVGRDLSLQRRRQHRPGTVTDQLIQQRPVHRGRGVLLRRLLLDYVEHGRTFPNQRPRRS
jgi:hypothetical protein